MAAGDVRTARDSLMFLKGFLDRFPVYQGRPFWIAGESYGGMYHASPCDHPATPWQRCSYLGSGACPLTHMYRSLCSVILQFRVGSARVKELSL